MTRPAGGKPNYPLRAGLAIIFLLGFSAGSLALILIIEHSPYWQEARDCAEAIRRAPR